jgi:hypothetical protein
VKKKYILVIAAVVVLALIGVATYLFLSNRNDGTSSTEKAEEVVPAPNVTGKIKGYWSSRGGMVKSELDDAEKMKEVGVNTVTFSPPLSHTSEGKVSEQPGAESYVKEAINKAHKAGFRVMLETTPMNAGEVAPKVKNPKLFQDEMTKVAVKYAKIAEEYNVEYFAPIVEPAHHMNVAEADAWLQELLPKLKEVYKGPIMWKKQSMHLEQPKEFNQDHILKMRFKLESNDLQFYVKNTNTGSDKNKLLLSVRSSRIKLSEPNKGGDNFDVKFLNIGTSVWHTLKIETVKKSVKVYLGGSLLFSFKDNIGPMGGYTLSSQGARINKFEIIDTSGESIIKENFKSLVNWGARDGWKIENKQIVISSQNETHLLHDIDFSGYDYIAIDTFKRGQVYSNKEYIKYLEYIIDKTNEQAKQDGVPHVILAEFGGSIEKIIGWDDPDERAKIPMTKAELAQVTQMVLEMAEDKVDGYMYNGWSIEGQGIAAVPEVEAVIKKWYNSH